MKYSLRSLMIVVTLLCVGLGVLGARLEYLRRWAAFHNLEAKSFEARLLQMTEEITPAPGEKARVLKNEDDEEELMRAFLARSYHERMRDAYAAAIYRPWQFVEDKNRPTWMPASQASAPNPPKK